MKQMIYEQKITNSKSAEIEDEVTHRLPDASPYILRFINGSIVLSGEDLPFDDEVPRFTGADIDWSGIDQELGDESPFRAAVAELVSQVSDRFFLPKVNG